MKTSYRITVLSLVLGAFLLSGRADGQILNARLVATRMECIFCSIDLQKELKLLEGVEDWDVNIEKDLVTIYPTEDSPLAPEDLEQAVEATRLSKRSLRLVIKGDIVFVGERWMLQTGNEENRSLCLLADDESLKALLEAAGVAEPFSIYSRPTEKLSNVVVAGNINRDTPKGHINHPYTLQIDSYCLNPRPLSYSLGSELETWEWEDLRRQLAKQPGIYSSWWYPKTESLRLAVCGKDLNMEDLRSLLPENSEIDGK